MNARRIIAPAALAAALPIALATPAHAAPVGYHAKNSTNSTEFAFLYKSTSCNPDYGQTLLTEGEKAYSTAWTGAKVYGSTWSTTVYNGDTGAVLAFREYGSGDCVRLYPSNDYLIRSY